MIPSSGTGYVTNRAKCGHDLRPAAGLRLSPFSASASPFAFLLSLTMSGIASKLTHIIPRPSLRTGRSDSRSSSPSGNRHGTCRSEIASSCELFGLFKALADCSTGSDTDSGVAAEPNDGRTSLSNQDKFPEDADMTEVPSADTEAEQKEALNNWMQESLQKSQLQIDTTASRLAGDDLVYNV